MVGAGIGGLITAIALRKGGHEVTVFEQADKLAEVGAGIIVGPNAVKVLRALDLEAAINVVSVEPNKHLLRNWQSGRVLFDQQMKGVFCDSFGAPYLQAHRADLVHLLFEQLPSDCIKFNSAVASVQSSPDTALVKLVGDSESEFDAIVGADGIKSAVRTGLFGPETRHTLFRRGFLPMAYPVQPS